MSELQKQFLSRSEQMVRLAVENLASKGPLSFRTEKAKCEAIQKKMKELGLKKLKLFRISQLVQLLDDKGLVRCSLAVENGIVLRSIAVVKQKEAVA